MKQFEYKLHKIGSVSMSDDPQDRTYAETQEQFLNTLGTKGWELVMCGSQHLVFKRELFQTHPNALKHTQEAE